MTKWTPGPWKWYGPTKGEGLTFTNEAHVGPGEGVDACGPIAAVSGEDKEEAVANAQLIATAPDMLELLTAPMWLVWSNEHRAWWGPDRAGYCWDITAAGRYTLEEAQKIAATRLVKRGDGINPPELIQPAPEWLAGRLAAIAKARGE
jgi:hypothetical protein